MKELHLDNNLEQLLKELTVEELEDKIAPSDKKTPECGPGEQWNESMGKCVPSPLYILPPPRP